MHEHTKEFAFEVSLSEALLGGGFESLAPAGFDRERAIFPEVVLGFIRATQPQAWKKLESLHRVKTGERVLHDLCQWMDTHGSLATLRHGFKCYGRTLRVAFFKAAHGLNAELEARYAANRLGLTRQLHFSPKNERSLDVTLSVNGIPVVTVELKNPLSGQTVEDALRQQYRHDRDPRERIFDFKKWTLVHFAADTEAVRQARSRISCPATGAAMAAQAIRRPPRDGTTARRICGRRCCSGTACWICSRASCTCKRTIASPKTVAR